MNDDQEEQLHSVARQDAKSILLARQHAEESLRKQSEWLRIMLASIGDAVISTDADGRVTFMNAVAEALTGWTYAEAVGRPMPDIFRIVDERTRQPAENPALRALRERNVVGMANHMVLISRDGTERPIDDSAAPMRSESGEVIGAVLIFRDVTERNRAEEVKARLAAIVESSDDAVVSKTLDGVIRSWNLGAERLFGYTSEEAVGQHITLIIPPDRRNEELRILERLRRGERVEHFETVRVSKDGRLLDISLTVSPIRDGAGRVIGASKVARDITAQKQTAEALRQSEEHARLALDIAHLGTWTWNATTGKLHADDRFREVCGSWSDGPLMLTDVLWRIHPDDRTRIEAAVQAALRPDGNGLYAEEFRFVHADGSLRWVISRGKTLFERHGQVNRPTSMLGTILDVTERKRLEKELRERAEELTRADRKKDEFIALLAHELRNPLAPLRNGLQVMRLAAGDAAAVAQTRDMMERQLGHMIRLVDDLLDIARINQNKMELRRSHLLLADVVSSAIETARPAIEAAGHALTVSLPQSPVFLNADLTRLAQVFANLLTNSAKYTERGGRIWLTAERRGTDAIVSVRDTGIGIPAEALPRIFELFSQVDRSIERSTGGLGIGLALVKGLVEMHGGTVVAASDGQGKGSTFTVTLPALATDTDPQLANSSENGQTAAGPRRRMLVVDDNRDAATSMAIMLKLRGNDVATAHDGTEAIDAADTFRPQVILMDVGMPELNGLDATRRIREQPWGRSVVIIALTGWGQEDDRAQSQEAGCDGHLVKPVDLNELEQLLTALASVDRGRI